MALALFNNIRKGYMGHEHPQILQLLISRGLPCTYVQKVLTHIIIIRIESYFLEFIVTVLCTISFIGSKQYCVIIKQLQEANAHVYSTNCGPADSVEILLSWKSESSHRS